MRAMFNKVSLKMMRTVTASIDVLFRIIFGLGISLSSLYLAFALYGIASGYALPTVAIFRLIPGTEEIIRVEPYLSNLVLAVAAAGATVSWMGYAGILERDRIASLESRLESLARRWGIPSVLCLLLIIVSSGGWSGRDTGHPSTAWDILNLLPQSDAITYFGSSLDRASLNSWGDIPARRPLAQSLRDGLVFIAGYSHPGTILLQTASVSVGISLAAARILHWRGVWAAVAFVGLALALVRGFLGTMMTEPIGHAIAFFSCAYLCDALRLHSRGHAAVALLGITMGLMVRAGSMLTVPFLVLWFALAFSTNARTRARFAAIGVVCVGAIFSINALLSAIYSPPGVVSGASISLTLCGLSVGGGWGDCYLRLYGNEVAGFHGNEPAIMAFLLQKALTNIADNPGVLLHSMIMNSVNYVLQLPGIFLKRTNTDHALEVNLISIPILAGLGVDLWRRGAKKETTFWAGFFISTLASAAVIYADDGFRAMQVTYVVLAVLLALPCSSPLKAPQSNVIPSLGWRTGVACLGLVALLAVLAPATSHAILGRYVKASIAPISRATDDAVLVGGVGISGFLVLPDGAEKPISVPSVYYSDFRKIPQVEAFKRDYDADVGALQISPPFAFIIGIHLDESCCYYITPPEVMLDTTVKAWHLRPLEGARWKAIREMRAEPLR